MSFAASFFFSLQTIATIGYGRMAPNCHAADAIVLVESVTGMLFLSVLAGAMSTSVPVPVPCLHGDHHPTTVCSSPGMVHYRFARLPPRILFCGECVLAWLLARPLHTGIVER